MGYDDTDNDDCKFSDNLIIEYSKLEKLKTLLKKCLPYLEYTRATQLSEFGAIEGISDIIKKIKEAIK